MSAVLLVLLFVLIALNGFFVAAEFALVRVKRAAGWSSWRPKGTTAAGRVVRQLDDIYEALSACQVGITVASIGIGFLGEPAVAELIESIFGLSSELSHAIAIAFAFAFVTSMHISIGEQVPKMISISRAERTARRTARGLDWFRNASAPFTFALTKLSNALVRLFGVDPADLEERHTSEDLKHIIARSRSGGDLDPGRGGDARRRLSPARAAGPRGDDADPGGGHGRPARRRSRRRCSAASPPATHASS